MTKLPTCDYCGETIPADVLAKRHYSPGTTYKHIFCNREHNHLWKQKNGIYKAMSKIGNTVIANIKAETGKMPGPPRGGARKGAGKPKKVVSELVEEVKEPFII